MITSNKDENKEETLSLPYFFIEIMGILL